MFSTSSLSEYEKDVERLLRLIELLEKFREFGGSQVPKNLICEWPEAQALFEHTAKVRTDLPLVAASLLLYSVGRFEYYIKTLVEDVAQFYSSNTITFSSLSESLRNSIHKNVLEVTGSPSKYGYDIDSATSLLVRYAKVVSGDLSPDNAPTEVISITQNNLRPDLLADLLRRISIVDFWQEAAKQTQLKVLFAVSDDRACKETSKRKLDEIMELRNQIAHPSSTTTIPDLLQVKNSVEFLRILGRIVFDLVEVQITSSN